MRAVEIRTDSTNGSRPTCRNRETYAVYAARVGMQPSRSLHEKGPFMLEPHSNETIVLAAIVQKANFVWRFYVDTDGAWRWQQLGTDSKLLGESPASHTTYEYCVADAEVHGYRFAPSQAKIAQPGRTSAYLRDR